MPELPEVETIRLQLTDLIVGLKISDIKILHPKSFIGDKKLVLKSKITGVRRFGKMLVIDLAEGFSLAVHLKMTGQLLYQQNGACRSRIPNSASKSLHFVGFKASEAAFGKPSLASPVLDLPNKHTRVVIIFTSRDRLFFNDIRKFGWIKIVKNPNYKIQMSNKPQSSNSKYYIPNLHSLTDRLGPDPLNELTIQQFRQILKQSRQRIKLLLMDQQKLAGVGNIYANDALFLSKINPQKSADKVSVTESKALFHKLLKVLEDGIKRKGASKTNFVDVFGQKGSMQEHFYVYGREGESCPNQCGGKIERMTLGGRGTFFCRKCQSLKSNNLLDK